MIKTPENRKDISDIVDRWEKIIESRLDEHDIIQGVHIFSFDEHMSNKTTQELEARYIQAGWLVFLWSWKSGTEIKICVPEELDKFTD